MAMCQKPERPKRGLCERELSLGACRDQYYTGN